MKTLNKDVLLLLDPLESLHGPLRPAYLLAKKLKKKFNFTFASPTVNATIAKLLEEEGFQVWNVNKRFFLAGSLLTLEAWLRRTKLENKPENSLIVNFSQCFLENAQVYYAQGPMTMALDDMRPEMETYQRLVYKLARWHFVRRDKKFVEKLAEKSKIMIANSSFCASMYRRWGVEAKKVIYPPLDCAVFKPSNSTPTSDYVLTYAGKETKYSVLKRIAESGVKVKVFGSKVSCPKSL
ncbi:MAG: hypothetical protein QXJ02_05965, partial [Candidatus Bathyarchaeia archaeon]